MQKVKEAISDRILDGNDDEAVKEFKKRVSVKTILEISTPPDSDDEDGQEQMAKKRREGLEKGRERFMSEYREFRAWKRQKEDMRWHPEQQLSGIEGSSFEDDDASNVAPVASSTPKKAPTVAGTSKAASKKTSASPIDDNLYRDWYRWDTEQQWPWDAKQVLTCSQVS